MTAAPDAGIPAVVDACLDLHTSAMAGKQVRPETMRGLGGLAGLLVTPAVEWRVDGLAQLQRFCGELLDRFVEEGLGRSGTSKRDARELLGRCIGVDTSPMSVNGARTAVATDGAAPSEALVRKWRRELRVSPPVVELVRERLGRQAEAFAPKLRGLSELPIWESDPEFWPPAADWIQLREVLLKSGHLAPGVLKALSEYEEKLLVAARSYAGQRADEYLMDAVTPHPEPDLGRYTLAPEHAWRWFRQKALRCWEADYRISPPRSVHVPAPVERGTTFEQRYRRRAAAAMQLALGRAVTRAENVRGLVQHLYGIDERMRQFARTMGVVEDLFLSSGRVGRPHVVRGGGGHDVLRADMSGDIDTQVRELTQLAGLLRSRLSNHDQAMAFSRIYCTERAKLSVSRKVDPAVLLELDLADHSVDWDTVSLSTTTEGAQLREAFRQAVRMPRDTPFSANAGLRLHRYRSEMVAASKRHDWPAAVQAGTVALQEADGLRESGKLIGTYELECRQQIALGLAGAWVKQAEDCLLAVDEQHLGLPYARYLEEALRWSRQSNVMLEQLLGHGLPRQRGEDGRIGTVRWTAQTPTLVLRAQLAALTAMDAGLCSSTALSGSLGPAVGLEETDQLYLAMITNKYAGAGLSLQLAFWNALLHEDRRLPVAGPGRVSKSIERLDLLHCAPDNARQSVQLDFADVTMKLRENRYNANIIGKLREGTRVYDYFADVHPGFSDWSVSWRAAGGR